jgi:hypothetical protein
MTRMPTPTTIAHLITWAPPAPVAPWNTQDCSTYIEEVLLGTPATWVRPIITFDTGNGQIGSVSRRVDALQRFVAGTFPLEGLTVLSDLNGCRFDGLDAARMGTSARLLASTVTTRSMPGMMVSVTVG